MRWVSPVRERWGAAPRRVRVATVVVLGVILVATVVLVADDDGDEHADEPGGEAASRCANTDNPLIDAVALGRRGVVEELLRDGADPSGDDPTETPLTCAARTDRNVLMELLLEHDADPDRDAIDNTPLGYAAERANGGAVQLLLDAGADPDHEARYGSRPLTYAALGEDVEIVRLLLDAGAEPVPDALDAVTNLFVGLDEDESPDVRHEIARLLLDAGADPDGDGRDTSPLLGATANGDGGMADLLLEHGADPDHGGRVPEGYVEILVEVAGGVDVAARELIPEPSRDNVENIPPLVAAVWFGYDGIARALLDAGADPDLAGDEAYTAIFAAAAQGDGDMVELLLARGADPTPPVRSGVVTPAEIADAAGHDDVVTLLESAAS